MARTWIEATSSAAEDERAASIIGDPHFDPPLPGAVVPLFKVAMSDAAIGAVAEVLRSGYIGQGPKVDELELALASRIGNPRVLTVNSATSGLHLALHLQRARTAGDGKPQLADGDEVLTSALTCTATNWPILANGLRLRWVDVDPANFNIDLDDLERKLSPRTRAVMVVHWGGYPVDLTRLSAILDRAEQRFGFRPVVVEDCAHAWASTYRDAPLGNHGNYCVYSFQAIKHLTCGDGGALVVPDDEQYARGKLLRWYGIDRESPDRADFRCEADIPEWGFKFHMNDISAAIGLANLATIDDVIARHRANAACYDAALAGCEGVTIGERNADRVSSYWIYTIRVERLDDFMRMLKSQGVAASRVHERNDIHSCVADYRTPLPNLDRVVREMVSIPVGWWVTDDQRERIVDLIRAGW